MKSKTIFDLIEIIEKLKIKKGDAIILKTKPRLSVETKEQIKVAMDKIVNKMGKKDIPILILDSDLDIKILSII